MDLVKSYDYFDPSGVDRCHIIGCGSVGSTVAELLARAGLTRFSLYDFDTVCAHNIVNQMFKHSQIGQLKTEALRDLIVEINPDAAKDIKVYSKGYTGQRLDGYVFLAVDNIELRKKIVEDNHFNKIIRAVFDFRTGLEDAQHFACDWKNEKGIQSLLRTMNFKHEDANKEDPVSACGVALGVAPTVRAISTIGVANFVNFVKGKGLKPFLMVNAFSFFIAD